MKGESVSGPEDKSTEINQSEEDFFFFFKEQNFKDMWDKKKIPPAEAVMLEEYRKEYT